MNWKTTAVLALTLMAVSGCAQRPADDNSSLGQRVLDSVNCAAKPAPEERVDLEMVDTLTAGDRYYAALAQLQRTPQRNPEYWHRYGQLLAQTRDYSDAVDIFGALITKCDSPEAYHGLGVLALKQGNVRSALANLENASKRLPASANVRNDYGYALLLVGDYGNAQRHLRTALELQNGRGPARQNLAVAYILAHDGAGLTDFQARFAFSESELVHARELAAQMRK